MRIATLPANDVKRGLRQPTEHFARHAQEADMALVRGQRGGDVHVVFRGCQPQLRSERVDVFCRPKPVDIDGIPRRFDPYRGAPGQNAENLKLLFRDTNASAEAVINGAALERFDDLADRADVLVATRVTVTDLDGNNQPSKPYRLRVTVAQDDNGHMSFYDLKYPDGGN